MLVTLAGYHAETRVADLHRRERLRACYPRRLTTKKEALLVHAADLVGELDETAPWE
jgi:hypothetical protein